MRFILTLTSFALLSACASNNYATNNIAQQNISLPQNKEIKPKAINNWQNGAMVATANPLATDAALEVIKKGGSAIDAAIAAQTVLGLIEPQSSGIGGGGFMVYYDAKSGKVIEYDGREKAPITATPNYFIDAKTKNPMNFMQAIKSGKSTGAPSVIAMLHLAWTQYGKIGWENGFDYAQKLAKNGYALTPRTASFIQNLKYSDTGDGVKSYFFDKSGKPLKAGTIMHNNAYAKTMQSLKGGIDPLYKGYIAQDIIKDVHKNPIKGELTMADFANVKPIAKDALCKNYRVHLICTMGPPSSGGIASLMILGMLENFDMAKMGYSPKGIHYFIEAQKLGYADRDKYVADDAFVNVPQNGLLDKEYLKERSQLIRENIAITNPKFGIPKGAQNLGADNKFVTTGTSHFVIVDKEGNVVSMTTSVESLFGSQRMVDGFFLNNQLTDFSFKPNDENGNKIVNRVEAGKKPRSSMTPVIIFDKDGNFELATGSPGGSAIISYVTKTIIGILDWNMSPIEAISVPNIIARNEPLSAESKKISPENLESLKNMGHEFMAGNAEGSGIQAILLKNNKLIGAADPRREGNAISIH